MSQQPVLDNPKPRHPVKVISLEAAAARILAGTRKAVTAEPETGDPFTPQPNHSRKKMGLAEMEQIAEQMAEDEKNGVAPAIQVVQEAAAPERVSAPPPSGVALPPLPPRQVPVASESDILSRYGLTRELAGALNRFYSAKDRLTIELKEIEISIPILKVIRSRYSITVITPMKADGTTGVPKPGAEVNLFVGDGPNAMNERAYFPGAYAELPELGLAVMTFIRQESTSGKA